MTPTPTGQVIPTAAGRDLVLERVLPGLHRRRLGEHH